MKKVLVLGCTGSIGTSTLNIIRNEPHKFRVVGLSANSNRESLDFLKNEFDCGATLTCEEGIEGIAKLLDGCEPDIVVNGIAGAAGLVPSKLVLERGVDLALANKETVVMAWDLIKNLSSSRGASIIPVDSEHSAVMSLVGQVKKENLDKIILTASGGPFRTFTAEQLEQVSLSDALRHPTWKMGKKITVDSATLANKALEVIEAARLFDVDPARVQVVVHPQSLVHSLVRTKDGMLYAQISDPDMKHPILSALNWPNNEENHLPQFDLFDCSMTFFRPRTRDFPMLEYGFEAAKNARSYTIAFNAANEVAVEAFIQGKIGFTAISRVVRSVLDRDWTETPKSFEDVFEADERARRLAMETI